MSLSNRTDIQCVENEILGNIDNYGTLINEFNQSGYNKQTGLMASCNIVKRTFHGKTKVSIEDAEAEFDYTNKNDTYTVYPYSELNNNILYNYKSYFEFFKKVIHKYSDKVIVKELSN